MRKKKYAIKTKTLIFNLKILPFLEKSKAIEFYKKIKEEIGFVDENFIKFYVYFEKNWLNEDINYNTKYDFDEWCHYGKYDFKGIKKILIEKNGLKNYICFSNNCVESVNHLINSFITSNTIVSFARFEIIVKNLLIRMENLRFNKKKMMIIL